MRWLRWRIPGSRPELGLQSRCLETDLLAQGRWNGHWGPDSPGPEPRSNGKPQTTVTASASPLSQWIQPIEQLACLDREHHAISQNACVGVCCLPQLLDARLYGFQLMSCRASPRERAGKKPQTCYGRQHHSRQATCSASIAGLPALLDEHPGGVLQPQKLKRQTVAAGGLLSALHRHCSGTGAPDFSETLLTSPCTAQARLVPGSWQAAMARLSRLCL